jgi:hypothetical protein
MLDNHLDLHLLGGHGSSYNMMKIQLILHLEAGGCQFTLEPQLLISFQAKILKLLQQA